MKGIFSDYMSDSQLALVAGLSNPNSVKNAIKNGEMETFQGSASLKESRSIFRPPEDAPTRNSALNWALDKKRKYIVHEPIDEKPERDIDFRYLSGEIIKARQAIEKSKKKSVIFDDSDMFARTDKEIFGRVADHNKRRWEWIGEGKTFKEINGIRYSFPGDYATINDDGSINLLGRGSNCINTAGEKVYPEEVEEAIKKHPQIYDCLVVGLKDDKFGQKVVALASLESHGEIEEGELIDFTREQLSGYKLPKQILFVKEVMRAPNGKANYKWAKEEAESKLT